MAVGKFRLIDKTRHNEAGLNVIVGQVRDYGDLDYNGSYGSGKKCSKF